MHRQIAFVLGLLVILGSAAFAHAQPLSTDQQAVVNRLIAELGAEEFQTRESATQSLIKFGESATGLLEAALKTTNDPEVEFRIRRILADGEFLPARSPTELVKIFLEAVKAGNHDITAQCLTKRARNAMADAGMHIQPPGSPDATFKMGEVRLLPKFGGAKVDSTWTDADRSYQITWIIREQGSSWAIAGMATDLYSSSPPLVLNFEDPADMKVQVAAAEAQIAERLKKNIPK